MSLRDGAETIVKQCLNVQQGESVVVVNDGNDQDLIDVLLKVLDEEAGDHELVEYEEPARAGVEPPARVAEKMKDSDVFIAPTKKSISHTQARGRACENGARGATLPGITKEIWNTSLQADYNRVEEISEKAAELMKSSSKIRVETPSGTDLRIGIEPELVKLDTGIIHHPGEFGNLPAGEAYEPAINAEGILVIDSLSHAKDSEGTQVEIKDNQVVSAESESENQLQDVLENVAGARNIAEFGFGTNPEAVLIDSTLQDEKVLGTIHIAFGDNSFFLPENDSRRVEAEIHWDTVCQDPTVWFDDKKVLDEGEPVFLD